MKKSKPPQPPTPAAPLLTAEARDLERAREAADRATRDMFAGQAFVALEILNGVLIALGQRTEEESPTIDQQAKDAFFNAGKMMRERKRILEAEELAKPRPAPINTPIDLF